MCVGGDGVSTFLECVSILLVRCERRKKTDWALSVPGLQERKDEEKITFDSNKNEN